MEIQCKRVPLPQAAKELGMAPQGVREHMKKGLMDIGKVYPNRKGTGYRFHVYRDKLDKHLGKENKSE